MIFRKLCLSTLSHGLEGFLDLDAPFSDFQTHGGETLFVNIVSWPRVPKPKSREDNIPLYAAPLDSFKEKKRGGEAEVKVAVLGP